VKVVGVVGNAPTRPLKGSCFTDSSRSLRGYTPMKMVAGRGVSPRCASL
jgi:hypothetical protein